MRMNTTIKVIIGGLAALIVISTAYYFYGHHNCLLSRSFFLEKGIRDLLFFETHEPINYGDAVVRYEQLLALIRFDNRKSNYSDRYAKALRRTKVKTKATELFNEYARSSNITALAQGWALFQDPSYKELEEYGFLSFYWNGQMIDDKWMNLKTNSAEQGVAPYVAQGAPSGER